MRKMIFSLSGHFSITYFHHSSVNLELALKSESPLSIYHSSPLNFELALQFLAAYVSVSGYIAQAWQWLSSGFEGPKQKCMVHSQGDLNPNEVFLQMP